jgi:hypothetical protein
MSIMSCAVLHATAMQKNAILFLAAASPCVAVSRLHMRKGSNSDQQVLQKAGRCHEMRHVAHQHAPHMQSLHRIPIHAVKHKSIKAVDAACAGGVASGHVHAVAALHAV